MPTEAIHKLEPHRTLYLRGFDRRGAVATMHNASGSGFTLSGRWSDAADFAVLVLHDADDNFGHLTTTKYLPDFSLAGAKLDFDLSVWNCQHPVSHKYQSVPWGALRYITSSEQPSGTTGVPDISLAQCATSATGGSAARADLQLISFGASGGNRIQLAYQSNIVWELFLTNNVELPINTSAGVGYNHVLDIFGVQYTHTHTAGDTSTTVVNALATAAAADGNAYVAALVPTTATFGFFNYLGTGYNHTITIGSTTYTHVQLSTDGSGDIAIALAAAINTANSGAGDPYATATVSANNVILTPKTGVVALPVTASDGNTGTRINTMYGIMLTAKYDGGATITCSCDGNQGLFFEFTSTYPSTTGPLVTAFCKMINQTAWNTIAPTTALMAVQDGTYPGSFTVYAARWGKVNVSGTAVTFQSGQNFLGSNSGDPIAINGVVYTIQTVNSPTSVTLTASAGTQSNVPFVAPGGGRDGNGIALQCMGNSGLYLHPSYPVSSGVAGTVVKLMNGEDPTSVHFTIDFTARGIDSIRQLWMTLAPAMPYDSSASGSAVSAFAPVDWGMYFSNWTLTDPSGVLPLKVAGPGSVVTGNRDKMVTYSGTGWAEQSGFYYRGFARATANPTDAVTVKYTCQHTHDLYLGTSLGTGGGKFTTTVDGVAKNTVDTYADAGTPVQSRRLIATSVPAGTHTVVLTLSGTSNPLSAGTNGYFDYLQAVVASDVQDAPATYANLNCAVDFDTNQAYSLSPARLLWILQHAGFTGDIDFYAGVFFALKRVRYGGNFHSATVTISAGAKGFNLGTGFGNGDAAFLQVGGNAYGDGLGTTFGVAVYPTDDVDTLAQRLVNGINTLFVGIRAEYSGTGKLTITTLSPVNGFTLFSSFVKGTGTVGENPSTGSMTVAGDILTGNEGVWQVDASQDQPLNWGFINYLNDFKSLVPSTLTVAYSQELLAPPDSNDAAPTTVTFGFWNYLGTGYAHTITIGSRTYTHVQDSWDGSGDIAIILASLINAGAGDPMATATASGNNVTLTPRCGGSTLCSASDGNGPGTLKSGAWMQRYPDGTAVLTSTGFGSWGAGVVEAVTGSSPVTIKQTGHGYITGNRWHSAGGSGSGVWEITVTDVDHFQLTTLVSGGYTPAVGDGCFIELQTAQCNFNPQTMTAYMAKVYKQTADIVGAGCWLQFGEVLWWFFSRYMSEPIGWASYTSPISIGTTGPHHFSTGQRVIVAGVLGNTAANGRQTITVTDATHFTENGSAGNGNYVGGSGTVSGGGMAFYDAHTAAAAQAALGRPLATFWHQDDDPTVNSGADVDFLAGLLKAHIDAVRTAVLASHSDAKFELLWPNDVNFGTCYYTPSVPYPQGGRLNRAVNLPAAYLTQAGSGLDRLKIEALSWGATYRNGDNARASIQLPSTSPFNWPVSKTAYLVPWFNGGCPWANEVLMSRHIPIVNFWAVDHLVMLSWPLPLPVPSGTIFVVAPGA